VNIKNFSIFNIKQILYVEGKKIKEFERINVKGKKIQFKFIKY
jgi:hypothetical protein